MPAATYSDRIADNNRRAALRSRHDRDISGDYPPPGDKARVAACEHNLRLFLETYFPAAFRLKWSPDHLRAIERYQEAILEGGLFALAAPRGDGKTTRSVRAAIWALLYRHRRFVSLVGATEKRAQEMLKTIKTELLYNELLAADFRQVCYPLQRLEGHARKAAGQHFDGVPTRIEWAADRLVLPTLPPESLDFPDVGGSTVSVAGITVAIRGQSTTLADGTILRPELVLLDDPQTRESANSPAQSEDRLAIIGGDVLGMGGPGQKIAAVASVTVIRSGDLADVLLDRTRSPRWHGIKCKLLDAMPVNSRKWEQYAEIRAASLRKGGNGSEATEFYRANQVELDMGAIAAWPERRHTDELSAIQHAMNLWIDDPRAFAAEYQNEPTASDDDESLTLTPAAISEKLSGIGKGALPLNAEYITGFIDVHDSILYWAVCGWSPDFNGWIADYGTWPDQGLRYFSHRKLTKTLGMQYPGKGLDGAIRAGLMDLTAKLVCRSWKREDGADMRAARLLTDAGYKTDLVTDVCQHSPHAAVLFPSRGQGVGAAGKPISEFDRTRGDLIGHFWWIPKAGDRRSQRTFRFDTNYWKSFIHSRLATALGDPGCLALYGHSPEEHRMFADHLVAEYPVRTMGHGRQVDEWKPRPDHPDNHWLDCLVGNAAAASWLGAALGGLGATQDQPKRQRVRFSDLQRQKRQQYGFA